MAAIPAPAETLYERAREVARITGRLGEACAGAGGLTVIEGLAGMGKTRLLHELRAPAEERGMTVLAARGSELEQGFAFGVLRQALERPLAELDAADRAATTAGQAAHALPLFNPELSAASTESLLHGSFWLLANLAERRPVVLAVDDAQWADESSLMALGYLARRVEQLPVALVVGTRPVEPGLSRALVTLVTDGGAERLNLQPLGPDAVAALCATTDPAFVAAALQATGGNPFLLDQLLRELGGDRDAASVARVEPRGLGRVVLARLGERARAFATALVILGDRATAAECSALAELDGSPQPVDELVAAGVLTDDAEPAFRHPLIAAAVAAGLSPSRRVAWHRRAAHLLREAGAGVERVAVHLAACPPAGDGSVADVLFDAATQASARGAPTAAEPLLRRALSEPPAPEHRPKVLLALGEVQTMTGAPDAARHFAEASRSSTDPFVRTRAFEASKWWWGLRPDAVEDLGQIDALIASLPQEATDLRLRAEVIRLAVAWHSRTAMAEAVARVERLGLLADAAPRHPDLLGHVALWRMLTGHGADESVDYALRGDGGGRRRRDAPRGPAEPLVPDRHHRAEGGRATRRGACARADDAERDARAGIPDVVRPGDALPCTAAARCGGPGRGRGRSGGRRRGGRRERGVDERASDRDVHRRAARSRAGRRGDPRVEPARAGRRGARPQAAGGAARRPRSAAPRAAR